MTHDEALNIFSTGSQQPEFADRDRFTLLSLSGRRWSHRHQEGGQDKQREDPLAEAPAIAAATRTPV